MPTLDGVAAPTDVTTLNATTSAHGLIIKATAGASGNRNVVAIDYEETTYKNTALFDATTPAMDGTASAGTALTVARRDHVHPTNTARDAQALPPIVISGNGFAITTGVKGDVIVPFACTMTGWDILNSVRVDANDAIQIDVWKCTYSDYGADHPVNGDSIIGGSEIKIVADAANYKNQARSLSISLSAGDILRLNVDSCVNISKATILIYVTRT
jgi:hypothetical protein